MATIKTDAEYITELKKQIEKKDEYIKKLEEQLRKQTTQSTIHNVVAAYNTKTIIEQNKEIKDLETSHKYLEASHKYLGALSSLFIDAFEKEQIDFVLTGPDGKIEHMSPYLDESFPESLLQTVENKDIGLTLKTYNAAKYTDSKTKILNSEALKKCLENPIFPVSIIICDIDNFKDVNSKYKYEGADYALVDVANIFKYNIHKSNYPDDSKAPDYLSRASLPDKDNKEVFRLGGDEFIMAISNADENVAINVANRQRNLVSNHIVRTPNETYSITMTFGVATAHNQEELSTLIDKATTGLFIGKGDTRYSNGVAKTKNSVIFIDSEGNAQDVTSDEVLSTKVSRSV